MAIHYRVDQGSPAWQQLRLGRPNASQFHKIITPATHKPSAQAKGYMYRLIAERLLNEPMEDGLDHIAYVERGKLMQPNAAKEFEFMMSVALDPVGYFTTEDGLAGCSPDYQIVGKNEVVEVKCPLPPTQIGYLLDGPGNDYVAQVQGQMFIGGFERVHFFSWHEHTPSCHVVIERDEAFIAKLKPILAEFLHKLDEETQRARELGPYAAREYAEAAVIAATDAAAEVYLQ